MNNYKPTEDVHKAALAAGLDPVWVGCSCEECNKKFNDIMQIEVSLEMIGLKGGRFGSEEYLKNPLDIAQTDNEIQEINRDTKKIFEARTRGNNFGRFVQEQLHKAKECETDAAHIYQTGCDCKYCSDFKNNTSVFEKEIWNKAIEFAAIRAQELLTMHTAKEIRKLKK